MLNSDVLDSIRCYAEDTNQNSLELLFANLEIRLYNRGEFFKRTLKYNSILFVHKIPESPNLQLEVTDETVFGFCFSFKVPGPLPFYRGIMEQIPSPLHNGHIEIESDRLFFDFQNGGPKNKHQISLNFSYTNLQRFQITESQDTKKPYFVKNRVL